MSHCFVTPLDNLDGTYDHTIPVVSQVDNPSHGILGSFVRNITDGPFYIFESLPDDIKRSPGTEWAGAAQVSQSPPDNDAAIEAMLANPPKVSPDPAAVVWAA